MLTQEDQYVRLLLEVGLVRHVEQFGIGGRRRRGVVVIVDVVVVVVVVVLAVAV